jgi:two-component system OmpR family response regulator
MAYSGALAQAVPVTSVQMKAAPAATGLRVLLVEDDPLVREVLTAALVGAGFDVHAEPDGSRVERAVATFVPDIALIDVHLGDGVSGITVARRLRAAREIPFVFLTAAAGIDDVLAGFDVGGDDYVVKPFVMAELLVRMRAVLRRWGRVGRSVLRVGDLVIDMEAHSAVRAGAVIDLTHREFSLLATLAQHPGIVLSKLQLLTQVWGFEDYDLNLVEVHICALRHKLDAHGQRLIHTIRGVGYVLRPDSTAGTAG